MASVQKKNNNLYVVYRRNLREGGQSKPIYEKQPTNSERAAQKRADYITALLKQNKYANPSDPNDYHNFCATEDLTLEHFLDLWVPIYAPLEWGHSMYESSMSAIKVHIKPDRIAKLQIRVLTPADIAAFLGRLSKKEISGAKADSLRKRGEPVPHLSPKTIKMIRDLLNVALNSAKMWGVIEKNPVCEIPRCSQLKKRQARRQVKYERKIWAPEYMFAALKDMEETDPLLHLAVHLSFMSSSRGGETTAVTLDSIDFEKRTIQLDKTIQRIYFDAMDALSNDEIIFIFPNKRPGSKSAMVLKKPKTVKSDRIFYMTEQLEENIRQRIAEIDKAKAFYGDKYHDYNLLICLDNGDPVEPSFLERWFKDWQAKIGKYPDIEFHGLRHSCATYLMNLTHDNHKLVQQVTGHTNVKSLYDYTHVYNNQRELLRKLVENDFYNMHKAEPCDIISRIQDMTPAQLGMVASVISQIRGNENL